MADVAAHKEVVDADVSPGHQVDPQQPILMVPAVQAYPAVMAPQADFSHGLLDCCTNTPLCCDAFWCGWCQLGRQLAALNDRENDENCGAVVGLCCCHVLISFFSKMFFVVPCITTWYIRDKMRKKYDLKRGTSEAFCDMCTACWCTCCAMIQQHEEFTDRGVFPGGCCPIERRPAVHVQPAYVVPAAPVHEVPVQGQVIQAPVAQPFVQPPPAEQQ
eukprot:TRINITY_DN11768_c0_g7_i1.p2 TRINITY_DN11768_c0_g7~~TRINITY_DN11768_c0_g7_i1.p2  ORF type:complete len:217 (+),score=75.44 TRINITY_DN11768_c0_g7_i1:95-745(+)